jgi:transposase-like protein
MMETQTKTNGHVQRSASEWQAIVKRFAESGRSRAAFCRAEGISRSTFDVWHRKLRQKATPAKRAAEFVEVAPVAETSMGGWLVEIELPDGTIARLRG